MTEEVKCHVNRLREMAKSPGLCLIAEPDLTAIADIIEQLSNELAQVTLERNAAVKDLGSGKSCCASCKHDDTRGRDDPCRTCLKSINLFDTPSRYEWRGLCAEQMEEK